MNSDMISRLNTTTFLVVWYCSSLVMKTGEVDISFGDQNVSLHTTADLLERLLGHFLYFRGQIEKPLDQLKDENKPPARVELQYCERSTPHKSKGNNMFATPLNLGFATPGPKGEASDYSILTESIKNFSIHEEQEEVSPIVGKFL